MTSYARHGDADLVGLARDGDRAALAVLLHRTLPETWAVVSRGATDERHAARATHATYLDVLRVLHGLAESTDPREGIRDLARRHAPADTGRDAPPAVALPPQLEDEVWQALDARWPDGRVARRAVPWRRLAVVMGLALAAALLPVAVLGLPDLGIGRPTPESTVAATPVDGPTPTPPTRTGPLPDFTFPTPPELDQPPAVEADPGTAAEPAPEQPVEPRPPDDPEPAPAPEPTRPSPSDTPSTPDEPTESEPSGTEPDQSESASETLPSELSPSPS